MNESCPTPRDVVQNWLHKALDLQEGDAPFAWQEELFERFLQGKVERFLDIPTGLGKTAVMAIWLIARAAGANLPRRLVYVVDRRAVVDQSTDVAVRLRKCVDADHSLKAALKLSADRSLPISTLRGQHVDNREWLEDPASAAIIVGTVDMVGSRLLFSGYGTSRRMRPYHAGLLGADALLVLDEAHLVPPFEMLVEAVAEGGSAFGPMDQSLQALVPSFRVMSLSATGRTGRRAPFGLTEADLRPGTITRKRLDAAKRLKVHFLSDAEKLEDGLAKLAWGLLSDGTNPLRCILFSNSRRVAEAAKNAIEKLAKGDSKAGGKGVEVDTGLFVGGRRVFEREEAAKRLAELGFIAGSVAKRERPAFLFATSAAEVGVDLDADHMVCDLVAWERMVQRLGRVNRRGDGDAEVHVVVEPAPVDAETARQKRVENKVPSAKERKALEVEDRKDAVRKVLDRLPLLDEGARDASPGTLRRLKEDADYALRDLLEAATTPSPLRPALTRPLVDAWSMTSLEDHPGRPEIGPWLRGWIEDDPPQTAVAWRTYLPVRDSGSDPKDKDVEAFFEAAPPHQSELLATDTYRVQQWLTARAKALLKASRKSAAPPGQMHAVEESLTRGEMVTLCADDVAAIVLGSSGDLKKVLRLKQLVREEKADEEDLVRTLASATVVVDVRLAGLVAGLLDEEDASRPRTADDGNPWMPWTPDGADGTTMASAAPVVRFRIRTADSAQTATRDPQWRERYRFAAEMTPEGEVGRWLLIEKWRHDAATEEDRSAGRPQTLVEHQQCAQRRVQTLADRLSLPESYSNMLRIAAALHDEGKRTKRWQQAFNAPEDGIYAKTLGPLHTALLDSYRHEFGSLPFAAMDPELSALSEDLKELALHLIAAHHGSARPVIGTGGCEDAPPSALKERAREVALRFARLQKRWGPWGLAWWEALFRAADQQASRDNDAADSTPPKEAP